MVTVRITMTRVGRVSAGSDVISDRTRDRILVVEDEGIVAMELDERLTALGFEVVGPTATGAGAIALAHAEYPDLILMDVRLKGSMDGADAAAHIREQLEIPIVFLTAYADEATLARIKPVEPLAYVIKPFEERVLAVTIELALHRHRAALARDRMEREKRIVERRLAAILENTHDAVLSVDGEQRIRAFNKGAERVFGYTADEVLGLPLEVLVPEAVGSAHSSYVEEFKSSEEVARPMGGVREVAGKRRDGEVFPAEVSISKLNFDGEVLMTACVRDLSERYRLEQQFNQAQKMEAVGRLAASVAHDFNNLLAAVQSNAYLIRLNDGPSKYVDEIYGAVERGVALTRQLLGFSRPKPEAEERLNVNDVVRRLSPLLGHLVREDAKLHLELSESGAWVYANRHLLEQVLMNLVVNARDALPRGGDIGIRTGIDSPPESWSARDGPAPERAAVLEVWDTGTGIDDQLLPRIFEPFFTTKAPGVGTGLGLSTVRSIVSQAGGVVVAEKRYPTGSAFRVYLPLVEPLSKGNAPAGLAKTLPRGTETILLVDDDRAVLSGLAAVLERQGYRVLTARSIQEALQQASVATPRGVDLLVADVVLPDGTGSGLVEQLGERSVCGKALFMTGYTETRETGNSSWPAIKVVPKPIEPKELVRLVREALDRPAPLRAGEGVV